MRPGAARLGEPCRENRGRALARALVQRTWVGIRVPRRARGRAEKFGEEQMGRDCELCELASRSVARTRSLKGRDGQSQINNERAANDDDGGITNIRRDLILQRGCSK